MTLTFMPSGGSFLLVLLIAGIFLFGATVKGAMGIGMPLVSVPLLSLFMAPPQAMGLLVAPVLASNAWQAYESGLARSVLRRMSWLLAAQYVAMVLTVRWTTTISVAELNRLVGISVLLAAGLLAFKPNARIRSEHERVLSTGVGLIAGVMGGVSSLTGPVVITYLMALRLSRDEFVGSISVIYFVTALPMYATMLLYQRFGLNEVLASCFALLPMFVGLAIGRRIRQRLNEKLFRTVLLLLLVAVALLLTLK